MDVTEGMVKNYFCVICSKEISQVALGRESLLSVIIMGGVFYSKN